MRELKNVDLKIEQVKLFEQNTIGLLYISMNNSI